MPLASRCRSASAAGLSWRCALIIFGGGVAASFALEGSYDTDLDPALQIGANPAPPPRRTNI